MSEAVTAPNLMKKMALIVSQEALAKDRHTQTHIQTHTHRDSRPVVYLKLFQSRKTLKTQKKKRKGKQKVIVS